MLLHRILKNVTAYLIRKSVHVSLSSVSFNAIGLRGRSATRQVQHRSRAIASVCYACRLECEWRSAVFSIYFFVEMVYLAHITVDTSNTRMRELAPHAVKEPPQKKRSRSTERHLRSNPTESL